jgi:hypothetical protein
VQWPTASVASPDRAMVSERARSCGRRGARCSDGEVTEVEFFVVWRVKTGAQALGRDTRRLAEAAVSSALGPVTDFGAVGRNELHHVPGGSLRNLAPKVEPFVESVLIGRKGLE